MLEFLVFAIYSCLCEHVLVNPRCERVCVSVFVFNQAVGFVDDLSCEPQIIMTARVPSLKAVSPRSRAKLAPMIHFKFSQGIFQTLSCLVHAELLNHIYVVLLCRW